MLYSEIDQFMMDLFLKSKRAILKDFKELTQTQETLAKKIHKLEYDLERVTFELGEVSEKIQACRAVLKKIK